VEEASEGPQAGGANAQADQVANRDAQERPVLEGLKAENEENRAKNPPGRAQNAMSADEIGQQQHQVNAGRPSAAEAPGYDGGEPANSGASDGQRGYADRTRGQGGSRGQDSRGNDGPGREK
jgi:hypothetical protein